MRSRLLTAAVSFALVPTLHPAHLLAQQPEPAAAPSVPATTTATATASVDVAPPAPPVPPAPAAARLLRFPHIQGDRIAFVHGGDLWTAAADGGPARRLTSFDNGYELFPRISPDGEWVAFSGEYHGSRQIYLVPYTGGTPRRLTHYPDVGPLPPRGGYDHLPLDWTPDGRKILIRANRTPYGQRIGRYFLVDPFAGGLEQPLQIPEGGAATFSPDGSKLAYNIISREWRTWKRYRAGRAQDVYVYDLEADRIERKTRFEGTDNHPLWLGDRIYFTSDRTGTLNLYCLDPGTDEPRQITTFDDFDVLWPSRGRGGVIFEAGGDLWVMDQATEDLRKLEITLADDRPWLRAGWKQFERNPGSFAPSPSAKRVLVEFRGEIFSVPEKNGEPRNLVHTPGRRERQPAWSPDGRTQTWLAEAGTDYELFARDVATGVERQLTKDSGAWILDYEWSPDSRRIALRDKSNRLQLLTLESGAIELLDTGREGGIGDVGWSADSRWLCYTKQSPNTFRSIWICGVDARQPMQVSSDAYQDGSPSFDPKGRYLYFTSARDYRHEGYRFQERMYALLLRSDVKNPLAPRSDEEVVAGATAKEASASADTPGKGDTEKGDTEKDSIGKDAAEAAEDEPAPEAGAKTATESEAAIVRIEREGLEDRLVALPGDPGGYGALTGIDKGLLFQKDGKLWLYDLEKRESKVVLDGAGRYVLTPDRQRLLYAHGDGIGIAKPEPGQKAGKDELPLEGIRVRVVPQQEWAQIYTDAWRIMRDWFYDPQMHRVDWEAMHAKYLPLLAHASHRSDLDFLLGELIGELNCGHTYVTEGETPRVPRVAIGLLGCEFERAGDRYRIKAVFPGENWHERTRSPLTEPGVDVAAGDFLLAIDGRDLTAPDQTPYQLLENTVGRHVTLLVNDQPSTEGAREVVVRPIASELGLRHLAWVRRNAALVDELSEGRIGYVHVPNTAIDGHRELFAGFRRQARVKQAMLIDDRYNGGGWVPADMAMALGQPVLNYWARREAELSTTPAFAFEGPKAMLINGYSSSGGDAFPYYFRKLGLGKLIGKKTWGGLVGYSGTPRMVDGGGLAVPGFAFVNTDGEWDVEAVGVAPDIEVFDDPTAIQAGREPILEAAVQHLLGELERAAPAPRPKVPEGPRR